MDGILRCFIQFRNSVVSIQCKSSLVIYYIIIRMSISNYFVKFWYLRQIISMLSKNIVEG
jgi:hypothetical protein